MNCRKGGSADTISEPWGATPHGDFMVLEGRCLLAAPFRAKLEK